MRQYLDELMRDDDQPDNPPRARGYTNPEAGIDYADDDMTPIGARDGRTAAQASLNVGAGVGADNKGVVSNNEPTDKSAATTAAIQPQQPATTARETPIQPAPQIPAKAVLPNPNPVNPNPVPVGMTASQQDMRPPDGMSEEEAKARGIPFTPAPTAPVPGATAPVAGGTAPVAGTQPGPVSLAPANRQSWFINDRGEFSSGNQTQAGIDALERMDLKPDRAVLNRAATEVQRYNQTGESMHLDPRNPSFVKGWSPADYNNLVDWKMVKGIEREIDLNKPEDRAYVENWLGATFGAGNKGMHIDKLWGPHHVAAILEAAGQGGDDTPTPGDGPPPPERPKDPNEPEPDPYKDRYEEYFRNGMNPLLAYIGDEPKAIDTSRLRAIMGAQALGEGLRSIADVIHGPKGAPITEHKNNVTDWSIGKIDEAVRQFGSDKKEHRKMKLDALMYAMNSARNQANADKQDWRQSVAQMYDRFDKKVDRQDKQYKDLVDQYHWNKEFKLKVDQTAAELQQKGLDRKEAKELAMMQHGFRLQEQGQLMAHQKQMQDDAIAAGRYAYRGSGTDGGNRRTDIYHHKAAENGYVAGEKDSAIAYKTLGGKIIQTHPALADDVIAHMQSEIGNENVDRRVKKRYKDYLAAMGIKTGREKLSTAQRQRIIHEYADDFFTPTESGWQPNENGAVQSDNYMVGGTEQPSQPAGKKTTIDY